MGDGQRRREALAPDSAAHAAAGASTMESDCKDAPLSSRRRLSPWIPPMAEAVLWYLLFGLLHECAHLLAARIVLPSGGVVRTVESDGGVGGGEGVGVGEGGSASLPAVLLRALLGRYCSISLHDSVIDAESERWGGFGPFSRLDLIRHAGWTFSVGLVGILFLLRKRSGERFGNSTTEKRLCGGRKGTVGWAAATVGRALIYAGEEPVVLLAATATALEAVTTDLLGFVPALPSPSASDDGTNDFGGGGAATLFFCGNFGLILLNASWVSTRDYYHRSLSILETMVRVTMMRGAQTGGVVTFESSGDASADAPVAKRARVVNGKRTDLSKLIRAKVEKNSNFRTFGRGMVRGFYGHTRFATSSKATMGGTHPHRWSPRRNYRVYNLSSGESTKLRRRQQLSRNVGVENYITHNGDLDFYLVRGKTYPLEKVQEFLTRATGHPMPAEVDSAAIAGLMDLLRTSGSFALSLRYVICFGLPSSGMDGPESGGPPLPNMNEYEYVAKIFEGALEKLFDGMSTEHSFGDEEQEADVESPEAPAPPSKSGGPTLESIGASPEGQAKLAEMALAGLESEYDTYKSKASTKGGKSHTDMRKSFPFAAFVPFVDSDSEKGSGSSLMALATATVEAFFYNDLFHATKTFLSNAKGSFGLCTMSTLDADRQVCIAARGQPMSMAFYPKKGIVCYGSEQAAVKSGLNFPTPGGDMDMDWAKGREQMSLRLDLDDLGGEICLLDWDTTPGSYPMSPPNRHLPVQAVVNGMARLVLCQLSRVVTFDRKVFKRMTLIEGNEFVKPLKDDAPDEVLSDIRDIPKICSDIQEDWLNIGLNRMTAWHLSRCISKRLKDHVEGKIQTHNGCVDILLTGCEVSLWLAEQFATDLRKSFPRLFVKAVSSNKLLGLFGQEISIPAVGYPMSTKTHDIADPIVIIVSHSGGTFAPLACSNLLQSFSRNIFVVASEWDTQVGKQLRTIPQEKNDLLCSRIFSTEVGVRPAEPCSVSVAATHQLLTNIFEYIAMNIVGDAEFRAVTGAVITDRDLSVLERCNRSNVTALEEIVGVDKDGNDLPESDRNTEFELRDAGKLWSDHVLEGVRAYILCFLYIVGTVTSGYPLVSGIARGAGLNSDQWFYLTRFLDSLIYFWLPQICIFVLRLIQRRNLRHRMVARTVVVADCPWVAQAGEAFLSKIFACSYSIAGIGVLSGNPADHLVHRHTHRVVRGSLLVCGRPDGRLDALTSLEATVCLSVNQASSIQSLGGTCESITIGHNPFKLPLSHRAIFLESHRPQFLCECVLDEIDAEEAKKREGLRKSLTASGKSGGSRRSLLASSGRGKSMRKSIFGSRKRGRPSEGDLNISRSQSSAALLGSYINLQNEAKKTNAKSDTTELEEVVNDMIKERRNYDKMRELFDEIDVDGSGFLDEDEFVQVYVKMYPEMKKDDILKVFHEADVDGSGELDFEEFVQVAQMPQVDILDKVQAKNRDKRGLSQVEPSAERYFGEDLRKNAPLNATAFTLSKGQSFSQELYESRIASLQRFVAMTVMFHEMGRRVQEFFPRISFGFWGYRMDRTHSIMRIATTASPVSGADVRERMERIQLEQKIQASVKKVTKFWLDYRNRARGAGGGRRRVGSVGSSASSQQSGAPPPAQNGGIHRQHSA